MNFISTIIKDVESWAAKIEAELGKILAKFPTWVQIASTTITFVQPILTTIVTLEGGPIAAAGVAAIIAKAQSDLTAAKMLAQDIGPDPTVTSILNGVVSDLSSLLALGGVKNATSVGRVKTVLQELQALVDAFEPATEPVVQTLPDVKPTTVQVVKAATVSTTVSESQTVETPTKEPQNETVSAASGETKPGNLITNVPQKFI